MLLGGPPKCWPAELGSCPGVWMLLQCSFSDCSQVRFQASMPSVVFEEAYHVPSFDLCQHCCFSVSRLALFHKIRRCTCFSWFVLRSGPAGPCQIDVLLSGPMDYSCSMLHSSKCIYFFTTDRSENQQGTVSVCDKRAETGRECPGSMAVAISGRVCTRL